MPTFTKLLAINMVAKSRSESLLNRKIFASAEFLHSPIKFKSLGLNEKNAISDADTKPEQAKRTTATNNAMIALISGAMNSIEPKRFMISVKKESESKIIYLLLKG